MFIVFVHVLHYQFHLQRAFISQFPEIDVYADMRKFTSVLIF